LCFGPPARVEDIERSWKEGPQVFYEEFIDIEDPKYN
jgi:hypothetical protein